jgi:serine protease Do
VWLHNGGDFNPEELIARWKPLCDRFDLILLAPKAADGEKWQPTELPLVTKLLERLRSTYTVDPARIVVHGHERGGTMAYLLAFRQRDTIRAVAAVEALPVGRPPENDPLNRLAVYAALAKKSPHAVEWEQAVEQLHERKIPVTMKDLGDQPRYLSAAELAELARWIDMLDRM